MGAFSVRVGLSSALLLASASGCGFIEKAEREITLRPLGTGLGSGVFDSALFQKNHLPDEERAEDDLAYKAYVDRQMDAVTAREQMHAALASIQTSFQRFSTQLDFEDKPLTEHQWCEFVDLIGPEAHRESICRLGPSVSRLVFGENKIVLKNWMKLFEPNSLQIDLWVYVVNLHTDRIQWEALEVIERNLFVQLDQLLESWIRIFPNFLKISPRAVEKEWAGMKTLSLFKDLDAERFEEAVSLVPQLWPGLSEAELSGRFQTLLRGSAAVFAQAARLNFGVEDRLYRPFVSSAVGSLFDASEEQDLKHLSSQAMDLIWSFFEVHGQLPFESWKAVAKNYNAEGGVQLLSRFLKGTTHRSADLALWTSLKASVLRLVSDALIAAQEYQSKECLRVSRDEFWSDYMSLPKADQLRLQKISSNQTFRDTQNSCYRDDSYTDREPDMFPLTWIASHLLDRHVALWMLKVHDSDGNNRIARSDLTDEFQRLVVSVVNSLDLAREFMSFEDNEQDRTKESVHKDAKREELERRLVDLLPLLLDGMLSSSNKDESLEPSELTELVSRSRAIFATSLNLGWLVESHRQFPDSSSEDFDYYLGSSDLVHADLYERNISLKQLVDFGANNMLIGMQVADMFGFETTLKSRSVQTYLEEVFSILKSGMSDGEKFIAARLTLLGDYRFLRSDLSSGEKTSLWWKADMTSLPDPFRRDLLMQRIVGLLKSFETSSN
jgi:hypothetical protein